LADTGPGVRIIAISVDDEEKSGEIASEVSFPVAHSISRDQTDTIGSWWDDNRNFVQPSEFILDDQGKVIFASYSSGPLARLDPGDVIKMVNFYESKKNQA